MTVRGQQVFDNWSRDRRTSVRLVYDCKAIFAYIAVSQRHSAIHSVQRKLLSWPRKLSTTTWNKIAYTLLCLLLPHGIHMSTDDLMVLWFAQWSGRTNPNQYLFT